MRLGTMAIEDSCKCNKQTKRKTDLQSGVDGKNETQFCWEQTATKI
jgi:hypothetical protein